MALGSLSSVVTRTWRLAPLADATEMLLSPESVQYRLFWSQSRARPSGDTRESSRVACLAGSLASWISELGQERT